MEDALISIACQDKQQSVIVVCLYARADERDSSAAHISGFNIF